MIKVAHFFLIMIFGFIIPLQLNGAAEITPIKVELIQEEVANPGQPFWVAIRLNLKPEEHIYWKNPGEAGIPLSIDWQLPPGFKVGDLQWPYPEKFSVGDMLGYGYSDEVIFLTEITPPSDISSDREFNLKANIGWLVCSSESCQPGSMTATSPLITSKTAFELRDNPSDLFKQARSKMPASSTSATAHRTQNFLKLELKSGFESKEDIQSIEFYPENQGVINLSIEPWLSNNQEISYLATLKENQMSDYQESYLKGVLVVCTGNGFDKHFESFTVNAPIQESSEVAFLDKKNPEKNLLNNQANSLAFDGGIGMALLFAFLGGMILNLMPCVLPVMSIKVMSFIKLSGESRSLTLKHGLIFSLGVLISFWILACAMLILRAYGKAVGWGFQLQDPIFIVILASLLFIFALNLFGIFEIGTSMSSWAGQAQSEQSQKSSGYLASFFSGVLATAVATPCTGPFLGSAVGFAVTLPAWQSLLIFTSLAIGMSFPYLMLAAFPIGLRFIPKPGAWMETFKQLMGFFLLATVLWLLWVFSAQTNALSLIFLLAGFLFFSVAAWVYGRNACSLGSRKKRLFGYGAVGLIALLGCQLIFFPFESWYQSQLKADSHDTSSGWLAFSPELLAKSRSEGRPVLIDFTAKWCLICQTNHMVLAGKKVEEHLQQKGVVKMIADWTKNDSMITEALSQFGRNSVPLYVLYGANKEKEPAILPQILSESIVINHLSELPSWNEVAIN